MNAQAELTTRGFKKEGFWNDTDIKKFNPNLTPGIISKRYFLYAYVIDDEVMYIGKCHRTVSSRMNDYALNKCKDYPTQNVQGLRKAMSGNINVDIYIYVPLIQIQGIITVDGKAINNNDLLEDISKGILDGLEQKFIREFNDKNECLWNSQISKNTPSEKKTYGLLTSAEKKEILKKLQKKLGTDVEALGYLRYKTSERYRVAVGDGFTKLTRDTLYDENGIQIPTNPEYHNIFGFAKGVAVVCVRSNTQFIETETGPRFIQDRKDGLIDVNGKELLPCIYDSIHVQGDGFVEITKDGQCKTTRVDIITNGEFDWDKAMPCNS